MPLQSQDFVPCVADGAKSFLDRRYLRLGNTMVTWAPQGFHGEQNFSVRPSKRSNSWSHSSFERTREYSSKANASKEDNWQERVRADLGSASEASEPTMTPDAYPQLIVSTSTEDTGIKDCGIQVQETGNSKKQKANLKSRKHAQKAAAHTCALLGQRTADWAEESVEDDNAGAWVDDSLWRNKASDLSPNCNRRKIEKQRAEKQTVHGKPEHNAPAGDTTDVPDGCTLMIRNIPEHVSSEELIDEITREGLAGNMQALYMPVQFGSQSHTNLSYAFLNLDTVEAARTLIGKWHKKPIFQPSRKSALNLSWASVGGLRENLDLWLKTKTRNIKNQRFRPVLFNAALKFNFNGTVKSNKTR